MFITLEADYAVRIVSVLCREKDKMDAKTISNDACVTLRFALKILRKLVAALRALNSIHACKRSIFLTALNIGWFSLAKRAEVLDFSGLIQ